MRPLFLRAYANVSDWWERETKFGRQATGGFASLLGVLANEFKHGDIFLGRPKLIIGGMLRPIGIQTEKHMVTIAGTGSGKSTAALIPNLCIHRGSALIIDPKGELAAITARRRGNGGGGVRGMGQDVFVLDPFHIVPGFATASYNIFDEMERVAEYDADRPVSYARKVAQALVPSTSRDPYWDDAPRTFISGLLLYIFQGPEEQRNLVRLRELLMEGDVETYQKLTQSGGDQRGDAFDALLVMMKQCPEGPYRHVIVGSANSLSKMSHNQRGSVLTMAMEHTSFLDMPEIRRISMSSDFLLEDLKNRAISIYLCLPLNAVSGIEGRWLRMFVLLTVDMMTRVSKAPNPPLLLAIDEFPSLGKLDGIETVAPTMRSVGVRLWVIGQDLEQFEKVYPESWGGFIGNAEAVQFMGITHPPTVAWLAERLGQHVIVDYQKVGPEIRENRSERALREPGPGRPHAVQGQQEPDRLAGQQAPDAAEDLPVFRVHAVVVLLARSALPREIQPLDMARGGGHRAAAEAAAAPGGRATQAAKNAAAKSAQGGRGNRAGRSSETGDEEGGRGEVLSAAAPRPCGRRPRCRWIPIFQRTGSARETNRYGAGHKSDMGRRGQEFPRPGGRGGRLQVAEKKHGNLRRLEAQRTYTGKVRLKKPA